MEILALLPLALAVAAFFAHRYYKRWREQQLRDAPFPDAWLGYLIAGLPLYNALSEDERSKLQKLIQIFINKKRFYGCAGLTITDEIRVTIAAEACLLLINRGWSVYPKLTSVLVYPTAFQVERDQHQGDGTVASGEQGMLGESWGNGRVILSWNDVAHGVADFTDGHNVALHEFAHQLDAESGSTNGAPPLRSTSYKSWATVFSTNFEDLQQRSDHGRKTVMDTYGATNPAEFFAVATETFFEKPHELHQVRPELFEELVGYYGVDPRGWH
jgi:Mlc titration factor MtfA (ptsG expression regulator)